ATAWRKPSSPFAITCAFVTPAPRVTRAPVGRISVKPRSVERTTVENEVSPSLIARITSVPPARKRAARSDCSAEAASPRLANVFTVIGITIPQSRRQMAADRLEARLIDLFADH